MLKLLIISTQNFGLWKNCLTRYILFFRPYVNIFFIQNTVCKIVKLHIFGFFLGGGGLINTV